MRYECDGHHLPRQCNKNFYDAIKFFQGKKVVNTPLHVKDVQADENGVHILPQEQDVEDLTTPQNSFLQDLLGEDFVLEEYANQVQQTIIHGV